MTVLGTWKPARCRQEGSHGTRESPRCPRKPPHVQGATGHFLQSISAREGTHAGHTDKRGRLGADRAGRPAA